MKIETFAVNPFKMNCYVYFDEVNKQGVLIDPGVFTHHEKHQIENYIKSQNVRIELILNTHGHIDHIMGNSWAKETYNVPLLMHEADLPLIDKAVDQAKLYGVDFPKPPKPDKFISEGEVISAGNGKLKVLHTPGHSPGSVCFVDEESKIIIGGDVLFKGSIGRTDLWQGDMDTLLNSIHDKLLVYPNDFAIYPGHYDETTIGDEKKYNPFITGDASF